MRDRAREVVNASGPVELRGQQWEWTIGHRPRKGGAVRFWLAGPKGFYVETLDCETYQVALCRLASLVEEMSGTCDLSRDGWRALRWWAFRKEQDLFLMRQKAGSGDLVKFAFNWTQHGPSGATYRTTLHGTPSGRTVETAMWVPQVGAREIRASRVVPFGSAVIDLERFAVCEVAGLVIAKALRDHAGAWRPDRYEDDVAQAVVRNWEEPGATSEPAEVLRPAAWAK